LERAEAAIVGGQIIALVVVVGLLGNYAGVSGIGVNGFSIPQISSVYWGPPSSGVTLAKAVGNTESTNATTISVRYSLAQGTKVAIVSASRLCELPNGTGFEHIYTNLTTSIDNAAKAVYFTFGSTTQPLGWSCDYTVTLTDSLQQSVTWVATVEVK
jgi:hypothetical protein